MESIPYTVDVIEKLRWNSHLGKHSHFYASQEGRSLHIWCGIPVVGINLILGSVFFAFLGIPPCVSIFILFPCMFQSQLVIDTLSIPLTYSTIESKNTKLIVV